MRSDERVFEYADGSKASLYELECVARGLGFSSLEKLARALTDPYARKAEVET